jgi:putative nucleotidyltransferase with HDIG domain
MDRIVRAIDRLPPFPHVATRAIEISGSPDSSADDLVDVLQYDQAVTANCLHLCNSSYFGLKERVHSLKHAVVLLGSSNVIRVIITDSFRNSIFHSMRGGKGHGPEALWWHSATTALLSQLLADHVGFSGKHDLFTAALLHDVGKLVIDRFICADFENMLLLMREEGFGRMDAEKAYYGLNHAELGGMIAEAWKFPDALAVAIRNHHEAVPFHAGKDLVALTAVSNRLSRLFQQLRETEGGEPAGGEATAVPCGLEPKTVEAILDALPGEIHRARDLLKIPDPPVLRQNAQGVSGPPL